MDQPRHRSARRPAIQVIATLPRDAFPRQLPANVRVEQFLPHSHILPFAACVVCHGGAGITYKALAAGVPVVAVPFAYDRFEVARRVETAGVGVMLPGQPLTPGRSCLDGGSRYREHCGLGLSAGLVALAVGVASSHIRAGGFDVYSYSMLLLALAGVMAIQRFYRAPRFGWKTRASAWFERALVLVGLAAVLWLVVT